MVLFIVLIYPCVVHKQNPKNLQIFKSATFASACFISQHEHLSSAGSCDPSGIDQRNHGAVDHCEGQNSLGIERHVYTGPQCHEFINSQ